MFRSCDIVKCAKKEVPVITSREFSLSAFYQGSSVDVFMFDKHKNPYDSEESIRVTSDIYMLFNQQRLDRMTREALLQRFDSMQVYDNSLASLRSKVTDDQLISLIKSRYLQSPSELLAWSKYLNSLADSELQAYIKASQESSGATDVNGDGKVDDKDKELIDAGQGTFG